MLPHRYEPVPSAPTDTLDAPEPECALDDRGTDSPRSHDESCEDNNEEDGLSFALVPVQHRYWSRHRTRTSRTSSSHPILTTVVLISFMTSLSLFMTFPFPTTIHLFVGMAFGLASWIAIAWVQQALVVRATIETMRRHPRGTLAPSLISTLFKWLVQCRWATLRFGSLLVGTGIVFSGLCLGVIPSTEHVPYVPRYGAGGTKYFIAATLHNNESLLPHWSKQLLHLVHHLGPSHTFVSIFESDSEDSTPKLLAKLGEELSGNGVKHRIITEKTSSPVWGYPSSPVRIKYLSDARNKAMEPLQSNDSTVRLEDYDSYTKVVFLGDVIFSWQSVVRLLATRLDHDHHHGESGNYDLACGMDFTSTGLYDTWTARDVCGTPMRNSWPYVKDPYSAHRLRKGKTIPVSACWNGMVAFPAGPYLYQPNFTKRGWKMIDTTYDEEDLATSPPLTTPLMFRSSGVDACDHSERFLFSYDIHRLHSNPKRPARIIMNPEVRTAYDWRWYAWENYVLRIPVVDWWRYYWSHGWPNVAVDWISEVLDRRRDYCTWSALVNNAPERCPPLPAAVNRKWDS